MLKLLLLLLLPLQVLGSGSACATRRRWMRTQLCPPAAESAASEVLHLASEAQCALACTKRLPMCKAAHFQHSVCSLAVNFTQLSLWSTGGLEPCSSLTMAPEMLDLLAFFDFRESVNKALGSASFVSEPLNVVRDSSGLHFAGNMTSILKLTIPGGHTALTDVSGERAVSFFMKVRRPYKSKSVFMKITSDSGANTCNFYENGGKLIFMYTPLGKQFTSVTNMMETDTDPSGFFVGVAASNVTGAFAFLNGRVYGLTSTASSSNAIDSVILLGYSSSSDGDCLAGTIVCFGIAKSKLSVDQMARLSSMCE